MATDARADLLFKALKDAQLEKTRLEQKLKETRSQRTNLEKRLEAVAAKHSQVGDMQAKMSEMLRVAHYKAEETQKQGNNIEISNQQKRKQLDDLNVTIKSEKERQLAETVAYEEHLSSLTKKFLDAKNFYTDNSLNERISELSKKTESFHHQLPQCEKELNELNEQMENINLGKEPQLEIPEEEQKQVFTIFRDEQEKAEQTLKETTQKLAELESQLRRINEEEV